MLVHVADDGLMCGRHSWSETEEGCADEVGAAEVRAAGVALADGEDFRSAATNGMCALDGEWRSPRKDWRRFSLR